MFGCDDKECELDEFEGLGLFWLTVLSWDVGFVWVIGIFGEVVLLGEVGVGLVVGVLFLASMILFLVLYLWELLLLGVRTYLTYWYCLFTSPGKFFDLF